VRDAFSFGCFFPSISDITSKRSRSLPAFSCWCSSLFLWVWACGLIYQIIPSLPISFPGRFDFFLKGIRFSSLCGFPFPERLLAAVHSFPFSEPFLPPTDIPTARLDRACHCMRTDPVSSSLEEGRGVRKAAGPNCADLPLSLITKDSF